MAVLGFAGDSAYVVYGLALWAVRELGVASGRFGKGLSSCCCRTMLFSFE